MQEGNWAAPAYLSGIIFTAYYLDKYAKNPTDPKPDTKLSNPIVNIKHKVLYPMYVCIINIHADIICKHP